MSFDALPAAPAYPMDLDIRTGLLLSGAVASAPPRHRPSRARFVSAATDRTRP